MSVAQRVAKLCFRASRPLQACNGACLAGACNPLYILEDIHACKGSESRMQAKMQSQNSLLTEVPKTITFKAKQDSKGRRFTSLGLQVLAVPKRRTNKVPAAEAAWLDLATSGMSL